MSQENVEIVREMIDRFNHDGFLPEDLFDPDVELFNARESPLPGALPRIRGPSANGGKGCSRSLRKGNSKSTTCAISTKPIS